MSLTSSMNHLMSSMWRRRGEEEEEDHSVDREGESLREHRRERNQAVHGGNCSEQEGVTTQSIL